MIALSWEQVNAWRLSQHHLHELADRQQFREVVSNIGGLHAQMMSAAELQLCARVHDLPPDAVQNALWHARTLIKSWIFRGTLHLVTASDFPLFVAALSRLGAFYRRPSRHRQRFSTICCRTQQVGSFLPPSKLAQV